MCNRRLMMCLVAASMLICPSIAGAWMIDSFFDVFTECAVGPAYPTEPVSFYVMNQQLPGGALTETGRIDLSLASMTPDTITTTLTASNTGVGGTAGVSGDVGYQPSLMAPDSFFDVFLEVFNPGGTNPPFHVVPTYMAPDSFFDVFLECVRPDLGGFQTFKLHFEAADGFEFTGVELKDINMSESSLKIDTGLHVVEGGAPNPNAPFMTITLTGTSVPEPSTLVLLVSGLMAAGVVLVRRATS